MTAKVRGYRYFLVTAWKERLGCMAISEDGSECEFMKNIPPNDWLDGEISMAEAIKEKVRERNDHCEFAERAEKEYYGFER